MWFIRLLKQVVSLVPKILLIDSILIWRHSKIRRRCGLLINHLYIIEDQVAVAAGSHSGVILDGRWTLLRIRGSYMICKLRLILCLSVTHIDERSCLRFCSLLVLSLTNLA